MYIRRRVRLNFELLEAWMPVVIVTVWSTAVVCLHTIAGLEWLATPVLPVTLVGIAVSLYVGFRSTSA